MSTRRTTRSQSTTATAAGGAVAAAAVAAAPKSSRQSSRKKARIDSELVSTAEHISIPGEPFLTPEMRQQIVDGAFLPPEQREEYERMRAVGAASTAPVPETNATSFNAPSKSRKSSAKKSTSSAPLAKKRKTAATATAAEAGTEPTDDSEALAAAPALEHATKRATSAASSKKRVTKSKAASASAATNDDDAASDDNITSEWKFGTVSREYEDDLRRDGKTMLIGVDEAGRGPLAGPVVAAAVYIPASVTFKGVNDSKILTETQRESLYAAITSHAECLHAVCVLEHDIIDRINILEATLLAMQTCVDDLAAQLAQRKMPPMQHVLIDGNRLPKTLVAQAAEKQYTCEAVVKGDGRVYSIAAASILAKVTRDRLMMQHHEKWPQWNFAQHKGYGVAAHMAAIHRHGPSPIHRMTFAPMKHMKAGKQKQAAADKAAAKPKARSTKTSRAAAAAAAAETVVG